MENKDESEEAQRRRRLQKEDEGSSSSPARWETTTAVEIELGVLECPICYEPLKPPVFQCAVGHLVCSCCRAKLDRRSCLTCGAATGFIMDRCFAVEHIVESVRVPCANAVRGCPAKTAYHGKEEHEKKCPHVEDEVEAVTGTGPDDTPDVDVPEQGRGNRCYRGLVAGLALLAGITVAIPVVRCFIKHFSPMILTVRSETEIGRGSVLRVTVKKAIASASSSAPPSGLRILVDLD